MFNKFFMNAQKESNNLIWIQLMKRFLITFGQFCRKRSNEMAFNFCKFADDRLAQNLGPRIDRNWFQMRTIKLYYFFDTSFDCAESVFYWFILTVGFEKHCTVQRSSLWIQWICKRIQGDISFSTNKIINIFWCVEICHMNTNVPLARFCCLPFSLAN